MFLRATVRGGFGWLSKAGVFETFFESASRSNWAMLLFREHHFLREVLSRIIPQPSARTE
ncbi:hypothetical protein SF83666_a43750 (plasmid) [Sinorhizobium fredii CCBAU 83666]|nr:hypothetical protein SF83666_a43750 [Sinorhizobium fredii CCBAU 83666]